jgi:hypothetical protein
MSEMCAKGSAIEMIRTDRTPYISELSLLICNSNLLGTQYLAVWSRELTDSKNHGAMIFQGQPLPCSRLTACSRKQRLGHASGELRRRMRLNLTSAVSRIERSEIHLWVTTIIVKCSGCRVSLLPSYFILTHYFLHSCNDLELRDSFMPHRSDNAVQTESCPREKQKSP